MRKTKQSGLVIKMPEAATHPPKPTVDKADNIKAMQTTINTCGQLDYLVEAIQYSIENTAVYTDEYAIKKELLKNSGSIPPQSETLEIVEMSLTKAAIKLCKKVGSTRVAVINEAAPCVPGGGALRGYIRDEAELCRMSTLYMCLTNSMVQEGFYRANRKISKRELGEPRTSSKIVYIPDVVIFNDGKGNCFKNNTHYLVDVISVMAPPPGDVNILKERLKRAYQIAIENGCEAIVIGSFGCGRGGWSPNATADVLSALQDDKELDAITDRMIAASPNEENQAEYVNELMRVFEFDNVCASYLNKHSGNAQVEVNYVKPELNVSKDDILG